ncbi:MAG: methionine aminotransferase [Bacteroidia bacterium]|nr:methionine aminotransferase [Bacteroidia bacterium]MDW8347262.1 methionine aminotransferase [Bacteroidia bacterium]
MSFAKSKLPNVGTTIFTVMSALANEHKAINLSQGFPDFEVDAKLIDLVHQAMRQGYNQYAPMPGYMPLREMIAEKLYHTYNIEVNPDTEITITSGGTEALFDAIQAIVKPDDEVIIFDPAYDCYAPAVKLAGGKVVSIPLNPPHFSLDWNSIKASIHEKTVAILLNTPHNPTGTILKEADIQNLIEIIKNTNLYLISDEVYEHLVFDNQIHHSVLRYPQLRQRSFAIYSFGKTFHTTGWKIGYCVAPPELTQEFRKIHQFVTFASPSFVQVAYAAYLKDPEHYLTIPHFYQRKRDIFRKLLQENTQFDVLPCEGSYFQLVSYQRITDEPDTEFAIRMTKEIGVAAIPVSVFYQNQEQNRLLRFCFAKKEDTLHSAAERLSKL